MKRLTFFSLVGMLFSIGGFSQNLSQYKVEGTGFIENKGQIIDQDSKPNTGVKYLLNSPGFNVQLRSTGFSYDTYTEETKEQTGFENTLPSDKHGKFSAPGNNVRYYHRVDVELQGCNPSAELITEGQSSAYYNYITASGKQNATSNIHYYQKVTYKNIYPHIDLTFFASPKGSSIASPVEYNFIVHPGGNPDDIKLKYAGASQLSLKDNKLFVKVEPGEFTENVPYSYWLDNRQEVRVAYQSFGDNVFGFNFLEIKHKERLQKTDLIIDPMPCLNWATYYGGGFDYPGAIAVDSASNVFIAGYTRSSTHVATTGAYQTTYAGTQDAFIAEFNPSGTALVWGTYYGTTSNTQANAIALDKSDNIYITGYAQGATGISTVGAYQTTFGGGSDAIVAKFNSTGTSLIWATYYGGTSNDIAYAITLDASNNVYIAGTTASATSIATVGAHQTTLGGSYDVFVAKFNSTGSSLLWGTYYGGSGSDDPYGIVLDASNNVYVTGTTASTTGIATTGTYQTTLAGGQDAFLAEINSTGSTLVWGTYYGGTANEYGYGLKRDASGDIYVTGTTKSSSGIATTGAYQTSLVGTTDGFVAKFNSTGSTLQWGTYYGAGGETPIAIYLDANNNSYISGTTTSTTGISTTGAYQLNNGGGADDFVAKFNSAGSTLLWGSYFGGPSADFGNGMTMDTAKNIYITGFTTSTSGISTPGSYQTAIVGTTNGFVAKFGCTQNLSLTASAVHVKCNGACNGMAIAKPSYGDSPYTYSWAPGGATSDTASGLCPGTYTCTVKDAASETLIDSVTITQPTALAVTSSASMDTICQGSCTTLTALVSGGTPTYTYLWSTGATSTSALACPSVSTMDSVMVTDNNGCTMVSNIQIQVDSLPIVSLGIAKDTTCVSITKDSLIGAPSGGTFSGTGVTGSNFNPNAAGSGTHKVYYTYTNLNGCTNTDSITVIVSTCAGVAQLNNVSGINLYPDPFSQSLNIDIDEKGSVLVNMYNMLGQNVGSWKLDGVHNNINTASYPSGVYVIEMVTKQGVQNKKIIKVD